MEHWSPWTPTQIERDLGAMIVVVAASGVGAFFVSLWTGSETLQWIGSASVFVISLIMAIRHRRRRRRANPQD